MILDILVLILGFCACNFLWEYHKSKNLKLPPGPLGLPIVGHLLFLGSAAHEKLMEWSKIYGPVIYCRFGSFPTVIVSDPKMIRQLFGMRETAERAEIKAFVEGTKKKGIIFSEGMHHVEQRAYAIRNMKNFGVGTKTIEEKIHENIQQLLDYLEQSEGKPMESTMITNNFVVSALWSILMTDKLDSETLTQLAVLTKERVNHMGGILCQLATFMPWMESLVLALSFGSVSLLNERAESLQDMESFMNTQIQNKKSSWVKGEPRDIADAYLDTVENTKDPESSFHHTRNIIPSFIRDLFMGGVETTSTTLEWLIFYMAKYPDVQKALATEIYDKVGPSRVPCLSDRLQMPYADSVVYELLRFSSAFALGLHHRTQTTITFNGYTIPENTMLLANLYSVHHDQEVWGDPEKFRPERWFGSSGKKFKNENFLPFSTGKRACPGEVLARDQLFLYSTALFQKFEVGFENGRVPFVTSTVAIHRGPTAFEVTFTPRVFPDL